MFDYFHLHSDKVQSIPEDKIFPNETSPLTLRIRSYPYFPTNPRKYTPQEFISSLYGVPVTPLAAFAIRGITLSLYTYDTTSRVKQNSKGTAWWISFTLYLKLILCKVQKYSSTVVPGGWQMSATWHLLSPWPASTHHLHTTPWWSREGSRTAARTLCLSGLKVKLSNVTTAPRLIDLQQSFQKQPAGGREKCWRLDECEYRCSEHWMSPLPARFWTFWEQPDMYGFIWRPAVQMVLKVPCL